MTTEAERRAQTAAFVAMSEALQDQMNVERLANYRAVVPAPRGWHDDAPRRSSDGWPMQRIQKPEPEAEADVIPLKAKREL